MFMGQLVAARRVLRVCLCALFALALVAGPGVAESASDRELRIASVAAVKDALRILVQDAGHKPRAVYTPYLDEADALNGVVQGEVDLAVTTMLPLAYRILYEIHNEVPPEDQVVILSTAYRSPEVLTLMLDTSSGVTEVEDLAGKTIGFVAGGHREMVLDLELKALGMAPETSTLLPIGRIYFQSAVVTGQLDAALIWPEFAKRLALSHPDRFVAAENEVVHYNTGIFVTTRGQLEAKQAQLARFLKDAAAAEAQILHDPETANWVVAEHLDDPLFRVSRVMRRHSFSLSLSESTIASLGRMLNWVCAQQGIEDCCVSLRDRLQPQLLSQVKPGSVWMLGF